MTLPYGSWPSPLKADVLASQTIGLSSPLVDRDEIYWLEFRPQENGRYVVVRCGADGVITDLSAPGTNVRTRVHEYGGGAFVVDAGELFYVNFLDQRVYRQRAGAIAEAITAEGRDRFADFIVDRKRHRLLCVREDHSGAGEAVNSLVSLDMDAAAGTAQPMLLASGHDFYASPRLSPDGSLLAWVAWRHPNMPWDGTELWLSRLDDHGVPIDPRCVAGHTAESICQPGWSPSGDLYFISDRDRWWRFYRIGARELAAAEPKVETLMPEPPTDAEFARPQWVLGSRWWTFVNPDTLLASYLRHGRAHLALLDVSTGICTDVVTALEPIDDVAVRGREAIFVGASPSDAAALVRLSLDSGVVHTLRASSTVPLDPEFISTAESIMFPGANGQPTHAFYYAPRNPHWVASPDGRPPLIVISHGGPTDAAKPWLRLSTQYWTTRGFALVDVDYGGSSGFGRDYRERLNGQWGVVDVADCVNAAKHLVAEGRVDANRLIIRGGSAGGYTTLAALTFHPGVFSAAASYYGICDLEVLARDTHKFESRYTDRLIGPYPEAREIYRERSPIHAVEELSSPLILFHGSEDKVVPPNQAELMAEALRAKGLPVALIIFDGEQHGFRRAASVVRSIEAELWFYGAVLGFTPADEIAPVVVANL